MVPKGESILQNEWFKYTMHNMNQFNHMNNIHNLNQMYMNQINCHQHVKSNYSKDINQIICRMFADYIQCNIKPKTPLSKNWLLKVNTCNV